MSDIRILDVRPIPIQRKHPTIFETFDKLTAGDAFQLVNDHEPRPLLYQFQFEHPGQFSWEYVEQGPAVWRVNIAKVK